MADKPVKENYQEAAAEAIKNQPVPDAETTAENPQIMDKTPLEEAIETKEREEFNVSAAHFVGVGVEMFSNAWGHAFGASEGAPLKEDEKEDFRSLFRRACDHYGLNKEVSGTKGFILELLGLVAATLVPRLTNSEIRQHLNQTMLSRGQEADEQRMDSTADGSGPNNEPASTDAIETGKPIYTVEAPQGA